MRRLLSATLWVLFTVVAVATGLGAVSIVRSAVTGTTAAPLSADQVAAELKAYATEPTPGADGTGPPSSRPETSPPPDPGTASPSPTRSSAVTVRTLASRGGTVVASCQAGLAYLRSWSPAEGFVVDEVRRGPAAETEVRFTSAGEEGTEVKLRVECSSGSPVAQVETDSDSDSDSE